MCQRHHPHLSLCQKDGCNAGNGGDMKEVGIPRWSSVEQTVPLCDGFESSTALKCGRIGMLVTVCDMEQKFLVYSRPFVSLFSTLQMKYKYKWHHVLLLCADCSMLKLLSDKK